MSSELFDQLLNLDIPEKQVRGRLSRNEEWNNQKLSLYSDLIQGATLTKDVYDPSCIAPQKFVSGLKLGDEVVDHHTVYLELKLTKLPKFFPKFE